MRIALAQINPVIGDIRYNTAKILSFLHRSREQGADLAVFPELSVTGYPPKDLLYRSDFLAHVDQALNEVLLPASLEMPCILGAPQPDPENPAFTRNAALLLADGRIAGRQDKSLLPNYDVFDESRYFTPATRRKPVSFRGLSLGLTVCEDIWNDKDFWNRRLYPVDPVEELCRQDCDLIVNLSASPYHYRKMTLRSAMVGTIAAKYQKPVLYLNQAGGNDDLIFDGESMVFDAGGRLVKYLAAFQEDFALIDTSNPGHALALPAEDAGWVYRALVLGIRDYLGKTGFSRAVIGLSGGIDSAVTAALATAALSPANVLGVIMPSRYSSEESSQDAALLAKNLGIPSRVIPLEDIFQSYLTAFNESGRAREDLAEENVQARIRGNILMFLSNREGSMVLTTGNKSEMAVGYCTLYGDMSGGLGVLADIPKEMVYELASYINRENEIIPARIIEKPPSAELRPDQRDADSLPPYPVLDPILRAYVEDNQSVDDMVAAGFDPALVRTVTAMVDRAEYKRRQAAPGLRVTSKAFGQGRRMPIAQRWCPVPQE
ncbi:MAG TPA: NAD+ synthase [Spirochaetia bacterium]|nr:NAD+ synthase [Spirochaetia bacterium]